ncbi:hypothetical protein BKA61DRAFT_486902 [Leptodontidium sp. MPI-SDFR-AT-0119]|nr:hypothetical protein BKA61DRAFT_486902 [Leptodontidium sp. MPI-SDFR-AT-0119]
MQLRRQSRQGSITLAKSRPPLLSPSIVAARAYYGESTTPIGQDVDAKLRRGSQIQGQVFPRRHSVLSAPKSLAMQLESFSFSGGSHDLNTVLETEETMTKVKVEESSDVSMSDLDDLNEVTPPRRNSSMLFGAPQEALRQVPFQYTHDHLRDWGFAYLGNSATADVFVNPVSLRRPSMAVGKDEDLEVKVTTELTTIRARIVPNGKGRKPFLIQRKFDIDELRRCIPKVPSQPGESGSPRVLRRSSRVRRSSTQTAIETRGKDSTNTKKKDRALSLGKGPLPIHIEYALHYLPVLGALMLSGHVRKGDSIDLPIPYPETWRDVLTYIYTGRGPLTTAMKENICFLAGHA